MPLGKALSELVAEFVGTFLFVMVIPLASVGIGSLAPIAIGFQLMAMVFSFAAVSGAHFNPAVSLAVFIARKMTLKKMLKYIAIQVIAAITATSYATIIVGLDFPAPSYNNSLVNLWQAFCAELVYTFALATVVLHVACSRQQNNDFYGFAIGMTILAAAFSVGGFTGGAFNPAVATGIQLVRCWTGDCVPLEGIWLYWAAPMTGAFLGGFFFNILDTAARDPAPPPRLVDFH